MKTIIFKISIMASLLILGSVAFSQTPDEAGCKDHPLFKRMDKFYIYGCKENFDTYEFVTAKGKSQVVEGTLLIITYSYDGEYGPNLPSKLEVIRNYQNEIDKMGGVKIYSRTSDDGDFWPGATFHFLKDSMDYWVGVYDLINNPVDQYKLVVLTNNTKKEVIIPSGMFEKIESGESLQLYIKFESDGLVIKNESHTIVDDLNQMLIEHPTLEIIIQGYTDNVGDAEESQLLSEKEAMSVKQALINKGIDKNRLQSEGYGQNNPIADNNTAGGRAENNRIEIKKM